MPTSFRKPIRPVSNRTQRLDEFQFDGGLVTDAHETKLDPNQSPELYNVIPNDTGSIKTRNGYLRYNTTPVGAASDQSNTGASAGTVEIDDSVDYVAQTFQPSGAISVTQADIYVAMQTSGQEQYVRVELWSTSGGAPSALLTNGTGQVKLISGTSETAYNFRFREPVSLSAATTYALVVKPFVRGSTQSVNDVLLHRTGAAYANGQIYTSADSGLNWTAAGNDLKFVIYGGGNTAGTGLVRYYNSSGIQQLFSKIGTSLYRGNDVTGAMTAITLGSGVSLTSGSFIDWTISNDTLLVVDGTNFIQKYRGSTNANYTTGTISVTNGDATVTGSSTVWATSTNAGVGEYIKLPDGKWYKIASIADNTHLEIEITDANGGYQGSTLAGQTYTISPWGEVQGKLDSSTAPASLVRPAPSYIENHINRIWTLEDNTARFSSLDTSVPEENFNDWDTSNNAGAIIVPAGKGDVGTGLYSLNGYLYVFQRNAIWEIFGTSPNNFELRNLNNEVGLINRRTLVEYSNILIFLSESGIYTFDGANVVNISDGVVNKQISTWANKTSCAAVLWDNKYIISYTPSGGSYNSEALMYDLTRKRWWKFTNLYANVWSNWTGGTDSGQVYFASSNQGTIQRWDVGGHDDGYEIASLYNTPSIGYKANVNDKIASKLYLQQLALGDWDMTATVVSDLSTESTSTINLSGGDTSLWDVAQWDVDNWSAEGTLITSRIGEFQGNAKYFKVRLEQEGYDEGIEALGLTSLVRDRRLR